ncbi:flagellar protein FlhE [Chromohalobacter canadensis]|uniref:Flagellar protein FlhE n=1 Tax=Chromohalobacter moromii TaxID=2860329 RepID=A0A9X3AXV2_9GAMM|nr:flagellar protein FlhE [Chromohalobacter canadensis]MCT8472329.1 flagellar protein FlhE [Chromohalobacter canadensis]MCT8499559.1 flagellar protein FlhE [Chromohalobacter canadensis]MCT8505872.1 flagellar protein FlhE [Chromohalobacter moromii]
MKSLGCVLALLAALGATLSMAPFAHAVEAGSWAVTLPRGPLLTTPGRDERTAPLRPPASHTVDDGRITRVSWRYATKEPSDVRAWLCHPRRCVEMATRRGGTQALEGLSAEGPFVLRFRRATSRNAPRASVHIEDLQLIVNYR